MLSILIILPESDAREAPQAPQPSVEVLHAHGLEEALEKLARNRRIDAVLLAAGTENSQIEAAILEDEPAPPALFRADPAESTETALDRIVAALEE